MAEIRNEKEKGGKGCDDAICGCAGNPKPIQRDANNSIRGAALSLCMTVDELLELLNKRDADKLYAPGSNSEKCKMLERIAELESTVRQLRSDNEDLEKRNKALSEIFIVTF